MSRIHCFHKSKLIILLLAQIVFEYLKIFKRLGNIQFL